MFILEIWWNVSPELIHFGPISIRWYGLLFALSFLLGYILMQRIYKLENKPLEQLDKLVLYVIIGTIVGARLGHCLFYEAEYYLSNPLEIIKVWQGGLASHGAAIGILTALLLLSRKSKNYNFFWILDRLVIVTALGASFVRLGNLFNSEIFGKVTDLPWAFIFARVDQLPRHPTQLYEAFFYFLTFIFLYINYYKQKSNLKHGSNLAWFLILVFGFRIFVEFFKENQAAFEANLILNMGQILSIPFLFYGIYLLFKKNNAKNK